MRKNILIKIVSCILSIVFICGFASCKKSTDDLPEQNSQSNIKNPLLNEEYQESSTSGIDDEHELPMITVS